MVTVDSITLQKILKQFMERTYVPVLIAGIYNEIISTYDVWTTLRLLLKINKMQLICATLYLD